MKVVSLLLDPLMRLGMMLRWRFLLSYDKALVCTNRFSFGKQLLRYTSKNPSVTELTSLVSHL